MQLDIIRINVQPVSRMFIYPYLLKVVGFRQARSLLCSL